MEIPDKGSHPASFDATSRTSIVRILILARGQVNARQVEGGKQTGQANGMPKSSRDATQKRPWRFELVAGGAPAYDFAQR